MRSNRSSRQRVESRAEGLPEWVYNLGLAVLACFFGIGPVVRAFAPSIDFGPIPLTPAYAMHESMTPEAIYAAEEAETLRDEAVARREQMIQKNMNRYGRSRLNRELAELIYDQAVAAKIDPDLAFGLVRAESGFKVRAKSHAGAIGLAQVMPNTARIFQRGITEEELYDPDTNLRIGFRYLRDLLDQYRNVDLALLAYNRGPGTLQKVMARGENPDNGYPDMVLAKVTEVERTPPVLRSPRTHSRSTERSAR